MKKVLYQKKTGVIRNLLEVNPSPLLMIDPDGRVTDVNRALSDISGMDYEQFAGTLFFDCFTDPQKARQVYKDIFINGSVKDAGLVLYTKKGRLVNVLVDGAIYENEEGNISGALVVVKDKGLRKREDEQTAHLAAIVTSSDDAIISKSLEGIILTWNKGAEKTFGYLAEEAIGKHVSLTIPPYLVEEEEKILEKVKSGKNLQQHEILRKRKDGVNIHVSITVSPIKDLAGNVIGVSTVERDVSAQKRFENELIESKRNAEQATRLAEEAVKSKQQFLSNMSHEIRTPLNAIIGFTKVVLKTDLTDKQKEYLDAIKISGDALIILINDILDLAKVDAGKMTFEQKPFKLADSVSSMLHLFETKIKEKGLELIKEYDTDIPATVVGDPVRLQQVVLNLLSNAVKFTSKGKITFAVRLLGEEKEKVILEFSVSDTGIGIAESKLERIFENFQQATDDTSRLYGGTGLGLAIVKKLVEAQHGKVWVKSKPGEGSAFYFTLGFRKEKENVSTAFVNREKKEKKKVASTEPKEKKMEKAGKKHAGKAMILVVEDVILNQLLMKTLLEGFGFGIDIAGNGRIAIEKMKKQEYDLVLMDLQMPEMNGFEATGYIRSELNSNIPIIALTADVTTVDVEKCRAVGMDDYLAKPINEKLLYSKMMKYLEQEETEQNAGEHEPIHSINENMTNLDYLRQYTKGNEGTLREMIGIYLDETPRLVNTMKQSIDGMDWDALALAAHSLIPSFTLIGMNKEYEDMTKKIQEHAKKKESSEEISDLVNVIEKACQKACVELEEYLKQTNV